MGIFFFFFFILADMVSYAARAPKVILLYSLYFQSLLINSIMNLSRFDICSMTSAAERLFRCHSNVLLTWWRMEARCPGETRAIGTANSYLKKVLNLLLTWLTAREVATWISHLSCLAGNYCASPAAYSGGITCPGIIPPCCGHGVYPNCIIGGGGGIPPWYG